MAYETNTKRASAGRVMIVPKGEWKADETYITLDLVNHNGYAFLAKKISKGIEPSEVNKEYWHNMLDINKIVAEAITDTLSEKVGGLLEARFGEMMSEARYAENLFTNYAESTFVRWDINTENTPYKAGLTTYPNGYALVSGAFEADHTVTAWVGNENFTHGVSNGIVSGWSKTISSSGGVMSGALGLGDGKGVITADDTGAYIESVTDTENRAKFKVKKIAKNVTLDDALKFCSVVDGESNEYKVFGEHNVASLSKYNVANIVHGSYIGTGKFGPNNPNKLSFPFTPKLIFLEGYIMIRGIDTATYTVSGDKHNIDITWHASDVEWYRSSGADNTDQKNTKDRTYHYVAFG
jgi:hypothetical protein